MLSDGWTFFSQTPESQLWFLILRLDVFGGALLLVMPVGVHPRDSCSLTAPPWHSFFGVPPASSPAVATHLVIAGQGRMDCPQSRGRAERKQDCAATTHRLTDMSVLLQWHTFRRGTFFGDREAANDLAGPAQRSWPGLGTARAWRSRAAPGPEPEPESEPEPRCGVYCETRL